VTTSISRKVAITAFAAATALGLAACSPPNEQPSDQKADTATSQNPDSLPGSGTASATTSATTTASTTAATEADVATESAMATTTLLNEEPVEGETLTPLN